MKIFFIRHGETTGDVENRYGGIYDDQLSAHGIEQGQELAEILKNKGIEIIYSSPLIRAIETAKILAREINCAIEIEDNLKERNQYGILSGLEKEEAKEKYPQLVGLLKDRLNTMQGAESYEDFSQRISQVWEKIISENKFQTICLLSHGGPLRVLFRDILKLGEIDRIENCAFAEFVKDSSEKITLINHSGFTPLF